MSDVCKHSRHPCSYCNAETSLGSSGEVPLVPEYMGSQAKYLIPRQVPAIRHVAQLLWVSGSVSEHKGMYFLHFSISIILWLKTERNLNSNLKVEGKSPERLQFATSEGRQKLQARAPMFRLPQASITSAISHLHYFLSLLVYRKP